MKEEAKTNWEANVNKETLDTSKKDLIVKNLKTKLVEAQDTQAQYYDKKQATAECYENYIDEYNSIKERQATTTPVRDKVRDAYLQLPEGLRVFGHGSGPNFTQPQAIRDFLASVPPSDPIEWCRTIKPNREQDQEAGPKPKKAEDPFDI